MNHHSALQKQEEYPSLWSKPTPPASILQQKEQMKLLAKQFHLHPLFMYHLFLHGYTKEEDLHLFFHPSWKETHSPFLLNEMKVAVSRILNAIQNKEKIMIFGDYDGDGITSSTLLAKGLLKLGGEVQVRLPRREEGYGLSAKVMRELPSDITLVITVDNGSSAHEAMKVAKERGVTVIVTDHHEVLGGRPDCLAFINPKRSDNTYPFPFLSGAGVALKVMEALCSTLDISFEQHFMELVEYAAIGTITDLMPLKGENRVICWHGLHKMNNNPNIIIATLQKLLKIKQIDSTTIGFLIGPIFNAMGRISDPNILLHMLLQNETNPTQWKEIIDINNQRKIMTKENFQLAQELMKKESLQKDAVVVLWGEFHAGIIGLMASRIAETYKKPTIVINHNGAGSARSVNGTSFSIVNVIKECGFLLKKFGGHKAAAGLSIEPNELQLKCFRFAIQQAAKKQIYEPPCTIYMSNCPIAQFPSSMFTQMQQLEPFGMENPKPKFLCQNDSANFVKQLGEDHLLLGFQTQNAFAFYKGQWYEHLKQRRTTNFLYTTNCYEKKDFLITDISR